MFTETLIAVFLLGALAGGACIWAVCFLPLYRQMLNLEHHNFRTERQRLYRAEFLRQHQGTPYIAARGEQITAAKARTFEYLLNDNDRWSRKAPVDLPDNVRAIGGDHNSVTEVLL